MFTMDRRSLILGSAAVVVSSALSRSYAQAPTGPFKLDPLPYPTSKNEPSIDAQTMEIHHDRHHAAYVNISTPSWPSNPISPTGRCSNF